MEKMSLKPQNNFTKYLKTESHEETTNQPKKTKDISVFYIAFYSNLSERIHGLDLWIEVVLTQTPKMGIMSYVTEFPWALEAVTIFCAA